MTTIRARLLDLFQTDQFLAQGATVATILGRMPRGTNRASVSRECNYMVALGLLASSQVVGHGHGKCFKFEANWLTCLAGVAERGANTAMDVFKASGRPLTAKDVSSALNSLCSTVVTKAAVHLLLSELVAEKKIAATSGDREAKFYIAEFSGEPWAALSSLVGHWARAPSAPAASRRQSGGTKKRTRRQ